MIFSLQERLWVEHSDSDIEQFLRSHPSFFGCVGVTEKAYILHPTEFLDNVKYYYVEPRFQDAWKAYTKNSCFEGFLSPTGNHVERKISAYDIPVKHAPDYESIRRYAPLTQEISSSVLEQAFADPSFRDFDYVTFIGSEYFFTDDYNEKELTLYTDGNHVWDFWFNRFSPYLPFNYGIAVHPGIFKQGQVYKVFHGYAVPLQVCSTLVEFRMKKVSA